jgi:hypothetical protein
MQKIKSFIKSIFLKFHETKKSNFYFNQKGYCPCCEQEVNFAAHNSWLRDHFKCSNCN